MKKSSEKLLRSGLLHQRELERRCDMPRGTINYWLNDTRPLPDKYLPVLELELEKIRESFKGKLDEERLKIALSNPAINVRAVCRKAMVGHPNISQWLIENYQSQPRAATISKLSKALKI